MGKYRKRRGRPSHPHSTRDQGTKELQEKRKAIIGGNSVLAESLLGVLYGRELISQPLYEAGCFFGETGYRYEACLGQPLRQSASILTHTFLGTKGANELFLSDKQDEERTLAWRNALKALEESGKDSYQIVLQVVFYDQDLYTFPISKLVHSYLRPLKRGLACLESYFREGSQDKKDKRNDRGLNSPQATKFPQHLEENRFYSLP